MPSPTPPSTLVLSPLLRCKQCQALLDLEKMAALQPAQCPACRAQFGNAAAMYTVLTAITTHLHRSPEPTDNPQEAE